MKPVEDKMNLLLLPLALCGFAVAQPVYNLLLNTPVFLLARQNTTADVWALTAVISIFAPLVLALPAWLTRRRWPLFSSLWCLFISSVFAALFIAQVLQGKLGGNWLLFIGLSLAIAILASAILLFTRWRLLTPVLAVFAAFFPLWFLYASTVTEKSDSFVSIPLAQETGNKPFADIIFVILDELPLATLLDDQQQIDAQLFPGFARLQSMSNWYFNATTVSDGTVDAVPAILTGRYPGQEASQLTVAALPVNLFTVLGDRYQHNAAEAVTRMCPDKLCPRSGPGMFDRFSALLLDLSAIYLHRVTPDRWISILPNVSNNWSGFFAERQVFFPDGWLEHAGQQTEIDRPGYFRQFTRSIQKRTKPTLNFMHILFPHEPAAYLPDGENYGLEWMRGQQKEHWGKVEWGVISGLQRHTLQTQYADKLLSDLLDHLQHQDMLQQSIIVVVADHGINFTLNDTRRALSANNEAAMLRIPLFIKLSGQSQGKRVEYPVMTIDILPTMLAALGLSSAALQFDGIDLESTEPRPARQRTTNSYLQRETKVLDESSLDLTKLVSRNRRYLKLNETDGGLWNIGPFDEYRGQPMESVCEKTKSDVKVYFDPFQALPNTRPEQTIDAFISGEFTGEPATQASLPFLITSNNTIVASGNTWDFNGRWLFFALVEPGYVRQADWAPHAWLLNGRECLGNG